VIPLGILGYLGWHGGTVLDRAHPFRGFLIVATALFVLCYMWTMGMSSSPDEFGEGSNLGLDPERAKGAKATGEFIYRYVLYLAVIYAALFFSFRRRQQRR
jgi:hypothetical protein